MSQLRVLPARVAIATGNAGKAVELRGLLASIDRAGFTVAGYAPPEEDGETYEDNAALKASSLARSSGEVALGDDSGLEVMALGGAPGLQSRRWASEHGSDLRGFDSAMRLVHERLRELPKNEQDARAMMVSALAVAWPDGFVVAATGRLLGTVVWPPRGDHRIGYEPMFQPLGSDRTLDEFDRGERAAVDARARAFAELAEKLARPGRPPH